MIFFLRTAECSPSQKRNSQALQVRAQLNQTLKVEQWSSRTGQGPCHWKDDPPATLICVSLHFFSSLFRFPLYLLKWVITPFHAKMAEILLVFSHLNGMSGYPSQVGYSNPSEPSLKRSGPWSTEASQRMF